VAQLLASPEIHRVPVVDREGHLVDIISQSNLIKFLSVNHETLKAGLSHSVYIIIIYCEECISSMRVMFNSWAN
jgi:predicted transcriptional regulator